MAYSKKVVEKFENTLNNPEQNSVGRWNPSDSDIGTGMVGAPACGDVMRLQIKCQPKITVMLSAMLSSRLMGVVLQ